MVIQDEKMTPTEAVALMQELRRLVSNGKTERWTAFEKIDGEPEAFTGGSDGVLIDVSPHEVCKDKTRIHISKENLAFAFDLDAQAARVLACMLIRTLGIREIRKMPWKTKKTKGVRRIKGEELYEYNKSIREEKERRQKAIDEMLRWRPTAAPSPQNSTETPA